MSYTRTRQLAALALLCSAALSTSAATVWDEDIAGDFSNNGLSPTMVAMGIGSNLIFGTSGNGGAGVDRDYFRFTVPVGTVLASLTLLPETTVSGSASFIAIQAGPQITAAPTGAGAENLLGYAHYGTDLIGQDLLATQFTGALGSGTYSVWIQDTGGPVNYGLDFAITPVPEPSQWLMTLVGLLGLARLRRRCM